MGNLTKPSTKPKLFTPKAPRINRFDHKYIEQEIANAERQFREASNLPDNVEIDIYVDVEGSELVVHCMPLGLQPLMAPKTIISPNIDPADLTPVERGEVG